MCSAVRTNVNTNIDSTLCVCGIGWPYKKRETAFKDQSTYLDSDKMVKTFQAYLPSCHRRYSCIHCRAHLANHDDLISKVRPYPSSYGYGCCYECCYGCPIPQCMMTQKSSCSSKFSCFAEIENEKLQTLSEFRLFFLSQPGEENQTLFFPNMQITGM